MLTALFTALLASAPVSPAPPEPPRPVCRWDETASKLPSAGRGYSLCVFGGNWFDLGLGYEGKPALERLWKHDTKEAIACFGSESIESFEWGTQRLTLTRKATGRLVHAIHRYDSEVKRTGAAAQFAAGEQKLKNLIDSLDWSSDIFTGWVTDMALTPDAAEMRKLVRDPSIRRSLEKAGRLRTDKDQGR